MKQKPNDEQDKQTEFISGRHPVLAALESERPVNKIFLQKGIQPSFAAKIEKLAKQRKIIISRVPKTKLDELTKQQNHQGVLLTLAAYQYADLNEVLQQTTQHQQDPFLLILDNIEDPHNLGSIMRTADAAGVTGIIIPQRRAVQLTATVAKTSTGAIEHVPVARVSNLVQTVKQLKKENFWIFGTDMAGQDYRQWNAQGPVALIIGNEGKGISPLLKAQCDQLLTIPMIGHVQSLNASVAAGLLIYQGFTSRGN
ncbi:MAG: 23S rRNA (guanosine(2251)-2'-O)-methyltransferase RlmB [Liquorilactobacillus nagelii]|jgi:23S rRNA (guanosine2251-2'-O)-methyltransferase|uniref:23S rRNA (guanosine(2251)-2'-O)-methyltransferase RlmB n=1 Tax=Liquorilactobacillus nagelii TaxID=82688 RepID=UPI00243148CB|nr:23S rRNA (guanosine(2251)-2'-O)-methyltransferase RlmB [Liquorilactobacillus nagelii]MCI1633326.1 23S rRNA (guanosine(2251)-2'-O)-methyltransferase RlmB [Liquorilactobacillus nagelii]MCI1921842.1 23S rRNA (guanosine(2251)-2'-O)-methyltransferase RlmB [Liquorilactobacillus nagelii]MCI1976792.1 23S rRNA (guanosine(2251)-2'-O)-methyltransferase RlmB [Liquorilactobacillus nagelii]